jgi:glycine betaine/choline ABC-type transport system substrate-binding protein
MKTSYISSSIKAAALVTAFACGTHLQAVTTSTLQPDSGINAGRSQFESVDDSVEFSKRPEAKMLAHAYAILARGDHDYKGHRVEAMHHLEKAGAILGVDLDGDLKDHEKQALSDDKMRQAQRLVNHLIKAAIIRDQPKVIDQLNDANNQIDLALATK